MIWKKLGMKSPLPQKTDIHIFIESVSLNHGETRGDWHARSLGGPFREIDEIAETYAESIGMALEDMRILANSDLNPFFPAPLQRTCAGFEPTGRFVNAEVEKLILESWHIRHEEYHRHFRHRLYHQTPTPQ